MTAGYFRRQVRRSVIDDQNLEVGVVEGARVLEALVDRRFGVVGADDHAHRRPARFQIADVTAVPFGGHLKRGLGWAVGTGQAEVPAFYWPPAYCPRIRP